jgi:hypothetical protein
MTVAATRAWKGNAALLKSLNNYLRLFRRHLPAETVEYRHIVPAYYGSTPPPDLRRPTQRWARRARQRAEEGRAQDCGKESACINRDSLGWKCLGKPQRSSGRFWNFCAI